jgi:hypothetical protein
VCFRWDGLDHSHHESAGGPLDAAIDEVERQNETHDEDY